VLTLPWLSHILSHPLHVLNFLSPFNLHNSSNLSDQSGYQLCDPFHSPESYRNHIARLSDTTSGNQYGCKMCIIMHNHPRRPLDPVVLSSGWTQARLHRFNHFLNTLSTIELALMPIGLGLNPHTVAEQGIKGTPTFYQPGPPGPGGAIPPWKTGCALWLLCRILAMVPRSC